MTALVIFTRVPEWAIKFDSAIGNLSYGVYLNQFLVAYLLLLVNETAQEKLGRLNTLEFGLTAAIASTSLAAALYWLVERPVNRLRVRLKSL